MPTLKFYADTEKGDVNKLFKWKVSSIQNARERLPILMKQLRVTKLRAAFFNSKKYCHNERIA